MPLAIFVGVVAFIILLSLGIAVVIAKFYRKVDQGHALIINKMRTEPEVTFTGGVVYPIVHRAEVMEISVKHIEIERRGKEGLICRDNIRADIRVTFFVRVNKTTHDVLKVAQAIGCARASDQRTLEALFVAKFSEALKTVGKRLDFEQLYTQRDEFKDSLIEVIGKDLNGYVLDDAAIDYLEQTPLDLLDSDNILDAQGIRKITELTNTQNIRTNELNQQQRMEIGKQNLEADEAIFRYEQQRAEAEARKNKEISMSQTREHNEAMRVKHEEDKLTALSKQKAEEEVQIGDQHKQRAVEVAEKAREREVEVEAVRIKKALDIEEVTREREVEMRRIEKERALEKERKIIADAVRERIAVEKTVASEEEQIKDLRAHAAATRNKDVLIVTAEGEAQQQLVKDIKKAEAEQEAAKFKARQRIIASEAALEAADKEARAKIRLAEGVQAEQAASGLAEVRVKEAEAVAIEKRGLAEARVTVEKMQAEATGEEKKGLVTVALREANAEATRKEGEAEAQVIRETRLAEAQGEKEKGLAEVHVREAEAEAIAKRGDAEASAIEKKLTAEAAGLAEKAKAMQALDEAGRGHEEYRLRLEMDREVALESVRARVDIAQHQASVLSAAFEQARINIVGGDGGFFEKFIQAVTLGQSIDGFVDNSEVTRKALSGYLEGEESLPEDLKTILAGKLTSENLKNLSVTALLSQLATASDEGMKAKLEQLLGKAKELGLDG